MSTLTPLSLAQSEAPYLVPYVNDTEQLLAYLSPIVLRNDAHGFCGSTWAMIGAHVALVGVSAVLWFRIVRSGEYWIARFVRMPKGRLLVINSANTSALSGAAYLVFDLLCRSILLSAWCYGNWSLKYVMVPFTLRYIAAIVAAWNFVVSACLIWPLTPSKIEPWKWHVFLVVSPLLALAGSLGPIIRFGYWTQRNMSTHDRLYYSIVDEGRMGQPASLKDVEVAIAVVRGLAAIRPYLMGLFVFAGTIALSLALLIVPIASVILRRLYRAERRLERDEGGCGGATSILPRVVHDPLKLPATDETKGVEPLLNVAPLSRTLPRLSRSVSKIRRRYQPQREHLDKAVPVSEARRLFRRFFWHLLLESTLLGLLTVGTCVSFIWAATSSQKAFSDRVKDPYWGSAFTRWVFVFFTGEGWMFMVLGHAYMVSVLWRQANPLQLSNDRLEEPAPRRQAHASSPKLYVHQDTVYHISHAEDGVAVRQGCETEALWPNIMTKARLARQKTETHGSQVTSLRSTQESDSDSSWRHEAQESDPACFIGSGMGRSLVLEALADVRGEGFGGRFASRHQQQDSAVGIRQRSHRREVGQATGPSASTDSAAPLPLKPDDEQTPSSSARGFAFYLSRPCAAATTTTADLEKVSYTQDASGDIILGRSTSKSRAQYQKPIPLQRFNDGADEEHRRAASPDARSVAASSTLTGTGCPSGEPKESVD